VLLSSKIISNWEKKMGRLDGKIAFISGASSGIGEATAILFAEEGAKVALLARRTERGEAVANAVKAIGGEAIFIQGDVSIVDDVNRAVEATLKEFGALDIGVNNAGIIGDAAPMMMMTDEQWRKVLNTNLDGVFFAMRAQAKAMGKSGGSIVNVASINSFIGTPMVSAYATSKHALLGLAKSAAGELAAQNIRVNSVCPGLVRTEMQDYIADISTNGHPEKFEHPYLARIPMGRMAEAIEIARSILFFASDDSSYCTGSTLTPDGGVTA
jgi:NAD(P)-dependent dehydrogenase (short-subunit alcohol dehydrogenase family)